MDAAGQLAQLVDGALELVGGRGQLVAQLGRRIGGRGGLAGLPERDRHGDQPLLRPVVEVAFDPPALLLGRDREAGPRRLHLLELRLEGCVQPLVLDGEPQDRHHGADERGILSQHRVVDDRGERRAVVLQQGHGVRVVLDRGGDRPTVGRRPAATRRIGSHEAEAGIAQRGRERGLETDGGRHRTQAHGERDERAARPA